MWGREGRRRKLEKEGEIRQKGSPSSRSGIAGALLLLS
jgi:hypothetical protein